jgi:PPOX class probable F420-dependent enzyme
VKTMEDGRSSRLIADLAGARTVSLTTYRRDGSPVNTPVHLAIDDGRAFFRTFDRAGKLKRLRRNPRVQVAPCTTRGRVTGPALSATARILAGDDAARARRALAGKYPLIHGVLIPMAHRLRGYRTVHLELNG